MNCDRDMCFHNLWNDIPCEECPCYQEEQKEQPTGEWIMIKEPDDNGNAMYECSVCHCGDEQAVTQEVPYCWKCGRRMVKGNETDN